jgi:hypothetical protein
MLLERERYVPPNWIVLLSYAGSVVASLAIWAGLYRLVQHFLK